MAADLRAYKRLDIKAYRADTFVLQFEFYDDKEKTIPKDITAYAFVFEARDEPSKEGTVVLSSTLTTFQVVGGDANVLEMFFSATEMDIEGENYYYDLEMETPSGTKHTVFKGRFLVEEDVTDQTNF
jgi:hypothetical protein